jgi:membrane-associated protein
VTSLGAAHAALAAAPALGPSWLDPRHLDAFGTAAPWIAAAIVFAECGLLIGFFLPGDTLLFTMGLLTGTGVVDVPIWTVALLLAVAAFLGNVVGYEIGRAVGPAIFRREDSPLFKHEHVERANAFFERWGPVAVMVARFVPIVRTFITVTAGVARMDRRRYLTYSGIGAVIWAGGVTFLGYYLGSISFVRDNVDTIFAIVEVVLVGVVLLSVTPIFLDAWRRRRRRRRGSAGPRPADEPTPQVERAER